MNNIIPIKKGSYIPDIEIKGRTLVNLLGRCGNMIYKYFPSEIGHDTTVEFNNDIVKITKNLYNDGWIINWSNMNVMESGKNYIGIVDARVTGVLGNENPRVYVSPSMAKGFRGAYFTESPTFQTVYFLTGKGDSVSGIDTFYIDISIGGNTAPGDIIEFKDFRIYELSDDEYAKLVAMNPSREYIAKQYPYVDDIKCVVNPYLESLENLTPANVLPRYTYLLASDYNNYPFGAVIPAGNPRSRAAYSHQVKINPGIYTISVSDNSISNLEIRLSATKRSDYTYLDILPWGTSAKTHHTFSYEGGYDSISIAFRKTDEVEFTDNELEELASLKITLVNGDTPKDYSECHNSRIMFETKLHDGEIISRRNDGTYVKNSEWDELNLLDYEIANSWTAGEGLKSVRIYINNLNYNEGICTTYNGTICEKVIWGNVPKDNVSSFAIGAGEIHIQIPNTLSGWGPNYSPTVDEIKAFFLGWRMRANSGMPYNGESGEKQWDKLWSGIGTSMELNGVNVITGTTVATCPTAMNDQGYTPYKLIYKKESSNIEEIKTYGSLVINSAMDIVPNSGLVLNDLVPTEFNSTKNYCIAGNLSKLSYRMNECLIVSDSENNIYNPTHFIRLNRMSEFGALWAIVPTEYNDNLKLPIYADYLIYRPDTVTSFEFSISSLKNTNEIFAKNTQNLVNCIEELSKTSKVLDLTRCELSQRSNPNLLINSDFQVWQRGTSISTDATSQFYLADRWHIMHQTAKCIITKLDDGGIYIKRYEPTAEGNVTRISQLFENKYLFSREDNDYTFTIKYRAITENSVSFYIHLSSGLLTPISLPVDKNEFSITFSIPARNYIKSVFLQQKGTYEIEIYSMKLEKGRYATPFVPRTYTEELAMCQRYYQKSDNLKTLVMGNNNQFGGFSFINTMRSTPTVKLYPYSYPFNSSYVNKIQQWANHSNMPEVRFNVTLDGVNIIVPTSTTNIVDDAYTCYYEADAEIYQ